MATKKKAFSKETALSTSAHLSAHLAPDLKTLAQVVKEIRQEGKTISLTQGVWDLIHEGHAKYLALAKQQCDVLVVGVDSDALTKLRKGPSRPIVPEQERLNMLAHLRHTDILFLRSPRHGMDITNKLIQTVKPDILVLSKTTGDLSPKQVRALKKFAKKIVYLDPQSSTSTTARIRLLSIDGAKELSKKVTALLDDFVEAKK